MDEDIRIDGADGKREYYSQRHRENGGKVVHTSMRGITANEVKVEKKTAVEDEGQSQETDSVPLVAG